MGNVRLLILTFTGSVQFFYSEQRGEKQTRLYSAAFAKSDDSLLRLLVRGKTDRPFHTFGC